MMQRHHARFRLCWAKLRPGMHLRLKYLPAGQHPLHQRSHAQLAGDGQGLVQQSDGLGPVPLSIALSKGIGVVAAGPGQFCR